MKKPIDCVSKNVLNYYGLSQSKCNDAFVVENLEQYVDLFLKKYVMDCVQTEGKNKKQKKEFVFRGISSGEQKYSKITREYYMNVSKMPAWDKEAYGKKLNQELLYIRRFEQNASFQLPEPRTTLDIVAAAQHYTIRTRLIDWSTSPLVATLFALHEVPSKLKIGGKGTKYYLVMVADKGKHMVLQSLPLPVEDKCGSGENHYISYGKMLNRLAQVYQEKDEKKITQYFKEMLNDTHTLFMLTKLGMKPNRDNTYLDKMVSNFYRKFTADKMCFLETNFANSRIVNQRGLFQIAVNPTRNYIDNCMQYLDFVFISEAARKDIIKYCEGLGVNYYALMPDSQSIASEINRRVEEENKK